MDLAVDIYVGQYSSLTDSFTWTPLVSNWQGTPVLYRKCTGLESVGKSKNVYSESYADAQQERVDIPATIYYEPTSIVLDLIVKHASGANSDSFRKLVQYFKKDLTVFWDTQRKKAAVLKFVDSTEPKEDTYLGMQYLESEFKFTNIVGVSAFVNDTFANSHLPYVEAYARPIIVASKS